MFVTKDIAVTTINGNWNSYIGGYMIGYAPLMRDGLYTAAKTLVVAMLLQ